METRKILAQNTPSAGILTDIYIVPSSTQTVISTITVCNMAGTWATFRISCAIGGAIDSNDQYIYYDLYIDSWDTFASTIGLTLNSSDVVRIYSSTGNLTINLFGVEIT